MGDAQKMCRGENIVCIETKQHGDSSKIKEIKFERSETISSPLNRDIGESNEFDELRRSVAIE